MLSRTSHAPHACSRRLVRQGWRLFATAPDGRSPRAPPASGAAKLTSRRLISLKGRDAPKFLQGIITNNVRPESTTGLYAAFLTAPGRVLHDSFIYPTIGSEWHQGRAGEDEQDPGYVVEVDATQAEVLLKHLKRHKLRSKLNLRLLDEGELDIWSVWKEGERWTAHSQSQGSATEDGSLCLTDRRAPGMGQRFLLSQNTGAVLHGVDEAPISAYTIRRYLRGVAEGHIEIPYDDCLPLNCNIDIMGGIDFKKGCYLGQELTIRTYHTGVVRRRVLPVGLYLDSKDVPIDLQYDPTSEIDITGLEGAEIKRDDKRQRSTGKLLACIGNVGLGMCRLEQMSDLNVTGEPSPYQPEDRFFTHNVDGQKAYLKAFVPDWVRGSIREPKIQKRVE